MFMDNERARHILKILELLSAKYGGGEEGEAKAAAELTKQLGPDWKSEMTKGGLGDRIPKNSKEDSSVNDSSHFYKKVGDLMHKLGGSGENVVGSSPKPGEKSNVSLPNCDKSEIKKRLKEKAPASPSFSVIIKMD